jgi:hypothetical protein
MLLLLLHWVASGSNSNININMRKNRLQVEDRVSASVGATIRH